MASGAALPLVVVWYGSRARPSAQSLSQPDGPSAGPRGSARPRDRGRSCRPDAPGRGRRQWENKVDRSPIWIRLGGAPVPRPRRSAVRAAAGRSFPQADCKRLSLHRSSGPITLAESSFGVPRRGLIASRSTLMVAFRIAHCRWHGCRCAVAPPAAPRLAIGENHRTCVPRRMMGLSGPSWASTMISGSSSKGGRWHTGTSVREVGP